MKVAAVEVDELLDASSVGDTVVVAGDVSEVLFVKEKASDVAVGVAVIESEEEFDTVVAKAMVVLERVDQSVVFDEVGGLEVWKEVGEEIVENAVLFEVEDDCVVDMDAL